MKLKAWLKETGRTVDGFAKEIGEPPPTVRKWVYGQRIPNQENMSRIVAATNGAVTPNDFYLDRAGAMNPAKIVIEKCGGPQATAELAGVDVSNVYRWTYPRERDGTGGLVPADKAHLLLKAAKERNIDLEPADFFDLAGDDPEHKSVRITKIGARIRDLRRRAGLNQASFAKAIGVNQSTVSRWESGAQLPDYAHIDAIAKWLGTTVQEVVEGVDLGAETSMMGQPESDELIREIMRECEAYIAGQVLLATSADQRASVMASVFAAAGAAMIAGVIAFLGQANTVPGSSAIIVGGMASSILFLIGAGLCVWAVMPVGFHLPGSQPKNWQKDIEAGIDLDSALREQAKNFQEKVDENHAVLNANAKKFKRGAISGIAAPVVGFLLWAAISFFSVVWQFFYQIWVAL